ncbi:MAG: hypothetical protein D6732_00745, partial [Methanobacteriota archaeon]
EVIDKFFQPDKRAFKDVLVGVPGGMVGRHAFYAFMENVMRNAVKYNSESVKKAGKIKFTLTLHSCSGGRVEANDGECYILTIGDNISKKPEVVNQVRDYLDKELLTEEGEINHEGHGITEMRLCAEELSGGLRFAPDDGHCENCNERNKDKGEYGCDASKDYVEIIPSPEEQEGNKKRITKYHALRAYLTGRRKSTKKEFLTYDLLLHKPKLLGIVGCPKNANKDNEQEANAKGVYFFNNLFELTHSGVYFGVILAGSTVDDDLLKSIAEHHPSLPFRLMVLTKGVPGEGCDEKGDGNLCWQCSIREWECRDPSEFKFSQHLPKGRVRVIDDSKLYSALNDVKENEESFLGCSGWDSLLLRVYDAWLRAYKPLAKGSKWPLYIGFQRSDLASKWKDNAWTESDESIIKLHAKKAEMDNRISIQEEHAIVFDNHGQCFDVDENECSFYQKFGSKECLTLYQQLEHPPEDDFAFAFMIYSLVEAALTNVVIIDERVAQSVLTKVPDGEMVNEYLLYKQKIWPVFNVISEDKVYQKERIVLSESVTEIAKSIKQDFDEQENPICLYNFLEENVEGWRIIANEIRPISMNNGDPIFEIIQADVVVIHEGVLDRAAEFGLWKWSSDTKESLRIYGLAPWLVRCSGGGSHSDRMDNRVPFTEFSEIKSSIIQDINKWSLVKSLIQAKGTNVEGGE